MATQLQRAVEAATDLASILSPGTMILTSLDDERFQKSMIRWSEVNLQTPSIIFQPSCEGDVQKIIQSAIKHKIPFATKSGGCSTWSTIGQEGWIIDLSLLTSIALDTVNETATIQSGVLTKALNTSLSDAGFYLPTPTGSTVAFIPFMLGGGSSSLSGIYGMAVDSLLSARVIVASGELVTASASENEDLFWALKGAGQFFGVVTEVTMRMFEIKDEITSFTLIFLPHHIENVAQALETLVNSDAMIRSSGMAAILAPPGKTDPIIMVSLTHFRPTSEVDAVMQPLLALNPINQIRKIIPWANITDAGDALSKAGGFKSQVTCGVQRFSASHFISLLTTWKELVTAHPEASGSFFMTTFYTTKGVQSFNETSSAWSHRDIGIWAMLWMVAPTIEIYRESVIHAEAYISLVQNDQKPEERALFPNHTRTGSVQQRYRGDGRLEKLRNLKKIWDRDTTFGSEFL